MTGAVRCVPADLYDAVVLTPFAFLDDVNFTPLWVAILLGGVVGLEREWRGRPAGLRTHILVCLASTFLIYVSRNLETSAPDGGSIVLDPTRLGAGIVTGIGFLGAACVVRAGDIVRGITTGACIWTVSGLGIVIGYEAYGVAVVSTVAILFVLVALDVFEGLIPPVIYRRLVVRGVAPEMSALADSVRAVLEGQGLRVQELSGRRKTKDEPFELIVHVRSRDALQGPRVLDAVSGVEGVIGAEWLVPLARGVR